MRITLINPNIVSQKGDLFGSGIPYMPVSLCYLAAQLREKKHHVTLIDAFGLNPFKARNVGNYVVQGLDDNEIIKRIPRSTEAVFIYASLVVAHFRTIEITKAVKKHFKNIPVIVFENTQSVIAYSLRDSYKEFLDAGVDYIITGESEERVVKLLADINENKTPREIDGLIFRHGNKIVIHEKKTFIKDLDSLPFPAWDLLPLKNYWRLGYSHGPFSGKYLCLLTSRGCPYQCRFCIVPTTNKRMWRPRSPKNVVDEIEAYSRKFGVDDFHLEDLNPTIDKKRVVEISKEIISRGLKVTWKCAAGTKIDTVDEETIDWMVKAGCIYISTSPESGSPRVMKLMRKPFPHDRAAELVRHIYKKGIASQACFVLGFPGETENDLKMTGNYIIKLVKKGVSEVAMFIMTPIPGSNTYGEVKGYESLSQLTFSPTWRKEFKRLNKFRLKMYLTFFIIKTLYHPVHMLKQLYAFFSGKYITKMEMTFWRAVKIWLWSRRG